MVLTSAADHDDYYKKLSASLGKHRSDEALFKAIVNEPFADRAHAALLGLGIMVLLLVDKPSGLIKRIALSDTEPAKGALDYSVKKFEEIVIPVKYKGNFIAEAIRSGRYQETSDWQYLFAPDLEPEEARLNQAGAGIGCSFVYPLKARDGGALIFSYFISLDKIQSEHRDFMFHYSKIVSRQLAQIRQKV